MSQPTILDRWFPSRFATLKAETKWLKKHSISKARDFHDFPPDVQELDLIEDAMDLENPFYWTSLTFKMRFCRCPWCDTPVSAPPAKTRALLQCPVDGQKWFPTRVLIKRRLAYFELRPYERVLWQYVLSQKRVEKKLQKRLMSLLELLRLKA